MAIKKYNVALSIRTKLFFLILVAFSLLIAATSWRIGAQANKVSARVIDQSLQQSSIVLDTKIASRFTSIAEVATGIAKDGRVLPLVFDSQAQTLQDLGQEFKRVLDFDVLFFTDAQGVVLARSDRPEAIGQNMGGKSALFNRALIGEHSHGVIASRGQLLQMVVVPIFDNVAVDLVRGTVALGYQLSGEIAEEIHALTASDIGFFLFTRDAGRNISGASSTYNTNPDLKTALDAFFSVNPEIWGNIYNDAQRKVDLRLPLGDEDFHAVVHTLSNEGGKPLGFLMALRSRTELLKPFLDIQRTVVIIGLACLFIACIFAWFFARRISHPIIELVAVTQKIREGDYSNIKTSNIKTGSTSSDEVGQLYRSVIKMGHALKEKAQLETYLAQISDELDLEESIPLLAKQAVPQAERPQQVAVAAPVAGRPVTDDGTVINLRNAKAEYDRSDIGPGTGIDRRYKITRLLGAGAMGRVFLAQDIELDENVAIKVVDRELFTQQESVDFKEEIRLARQVTHRNILRTFDYGNWREFYYITMEYVSGFDLGHLLNTKGAFDINIGIIMARQICSAMNAAHEQGIIHRDLKPSNMMINRQGILKIMDFGLAMKVGQNNDRNPTTVAGTPRYMAPEQFYGGQLDERTDIYAIGAILYAIFNGAPPFSANGFKELANLHMTAKVPRIKAKGGQLPIALQKIIHKALAKKPEHRYKSVRQILDELNAVSSS
ncbi:protein kinase [Exilibacterium tricleocarpae]|uniref:Protein kinase n=1 Tax=Exilibacterium tricleocarpae TaxID=2591008 RepID=A0A545SPT7_9GAMM|nr:serine/threonine-protein kinase [Exilibacterium tricleocarpae]TQV66998.1 protein kinase [Exilibacterium tricleocarpae]